MMRSRKGRRRNRDGVVLVIFLLLLFWEGRVSAQQQTEAEPSEIQASEMQTSQDESRPVRQEEARILLEEGRLMEAALRYEALLADHPEDPELAYRLGEVYLMLTAWSYGLLSEEGGDSARLYQALAQMESMTGNWEAAESLYRRAIGREPEMLDLHLALATVLLRQGRLREALAAVEKELEKMPHNAGARQMKSKIEAEPAP